MSVHLIPTLTDVGQFLDAFWPQLAATVAGVALGVPAALAIERRREASRSTQRDSERREAAALLVSSLARNIDSVATLAGSLTSTQTVTSPGLDLSVWEVTRQDVLPLCDVASRVRLARLFDGLSRLDDVARRHIEMSIGVSTALSGSAATREALAAWVREKGLALGKEAIELAMVVAHAAGDQVPGEGPDNPELLAASTRLLAVAASSMVAQQGAASAASSPTADAPAPRPTE